MLRTCALGLVAALALACARTPAESPAAPVADEGALVARGPFLLLDSAREAVARRDFATATAKVEEHRRRAPEAWLERVDLELVVACWHADDAALGALTRQYVDRVCPVADLEARPNRALRPVEPICLVTMTPLEAAALVGSEGCRQAVEATYAAIDA